MSGENILKGCLVESDPAAIARAREAKRRAVLVAIILQVLLVGLLVLAPLLGAVEKLPRTTVVWTPPVPYKGKPKPSGPTQTKPPGERKPLVTGNKPPVYQPPRIPTGVAEIKDPPEVFAKQAETGGGGNVIGRPDGIIDLGAPSERSAAAPKPPEPTPKAPRSIRVSEPVQLARLVFRVEPKYSTVPLQARMEGRVVLRAVIAKDGTIHSLEIVSGHPLFVNAAREAIAQWRYQPTLLNGEAVEVETVITVVFTLRR